MVEPIKFGVNGPENRILKFSAALPVSYPYTVIDLANRYTDAVVLGMSIADINLVFPAYTDPTPRAPTPSYPGPVFSTLSHSLYPGAITQTMIQDAGGPGHPGGSFAVTFSFAGVSFSAYISIDTWFGSPIPGTPSLEITAPPGLPSTNSSYASYQQSVDVLSCSVFLPSVIWSAAEWRTSQINDRIAYLSTNPLPTLAAAQWETAVLGILLTSPYHLTYEAWAVDAAASAADHTVALTAARASVASDFRDVDIVSLVLSGDIMSAVAPKHVQVFLPENQPAWAAGTFLQAIGPLTDAKRVRFFLGPPTSTDKTALYIGHYSGLWVPGYGPYGEANSVTTIYDRIASPDPLGTAYVDYTLGANGVWSGGAPSRALTQADLDATQVHVYLLPPRVTDLVAAAESRILAYTGAAQALVEGFPVNDYTSYVSLSLAGAAQFCADIDLVESAYISMSNLNMYARNWQRLPLFPYLGPTPTSVLSILYANISLLRDENLGEVLIDLQYASSLEGVNGLLAAFPGGVDTVISNFYANPTDISGELSRLPMVSYNGGFDWLVRIPPYLRRVLVSGVGVVDAEEDILTVDDHFMMVPRYFAANYGGVIAAASTTTLDILLWCEADVPSVHLNVYLSLLFSYLDGGGAPQSARYDVASILGVQYGHRTTVTHSRLPDTVSLVSGLYTYRREVSSPLPGVGPLLGGVCYIPSYDNQGYGYYDTWLYTSNGDTATYTFNNFGEPSVGYGNGPALMYPHFATEGVLVDSVLAAHPVSYNTIKKLSRLRLLRNSGPGGPFVADIVRTSTLARGVSESYNVGEHNLLALADGTATDISETYTPISGAGIASEVVTYVQAQDVITHP